MEQSSMQLGTQQVMTATGANVPLAVGPQLFSVEQIKPVKIPAGEKTSSGDKTFNELNFRWY